MNIIILGAHGFIGSHLVEYFHYKGDIVTACDLQENNSCNYDYKKVSILSSDFETIFGDHNFDYCINAAGSGNVSFSMTNPISDFESNTFAVAKVLDTIRKLQPNCKYVHISSAAVYGNPKELPIKENNEIRPLSPYGYNKYMSELLCEEYHLLYNLPIVIVRPFSVYGKGLKKQLLWDICKKINSSDTITLFGTGMESRDFLHISDLCEVLNKIITKSEFNADIYNAAGGIETTIRQIADIFENIWQGKKRIKFSGELKIGDPVNWKADISKINMLDFKPSVTLEKGIKNYWEWYLLVTK